MDTLHHIAGRTRKLPPLRVGVGGPVGSGKTALMEQLCKRLRSVYDLAAITNAANIIVYRYYYDVPAGKVGNRADQFNTFPVLNANDPLPPADPSGVTPAFVNSQGINFTESTVKTHFNRALAKLNLSSRAQAVVLATGGGGQVFAQTTNPSVSTGDLPSGWIARSVAGARIVTASRS